MLADYERHFGEPVLRSILQPAIISHGPGTEAQHYACRLFVNGMARLHSGQQKHFVMKRARELDTCRTCYPNFFWGLLVSADAALLFSIARRVVVDDIVPVATNGRLLCAHSAIPQDRAIVLLLL